MYAAVRQYQVHPEETEELARRVREGFLPLLDQIPGFRAYYLVDGGQEITTISVFEDAAGAAESTRQAEGWVRQQAADLVLPLFQRQGTVRVAHAP